MNPYDDIMVGVPKVGRPLPPKLEKWMKETKFLVETTDELPQEEARTILISRMLNKKYKYIFFIDSDMTPEIINLDETIQIFYNSGLPVVSCLTSTRGPQHKLLLFKKNPNITYPLLDEGMYKEDKMIEVYAIGFGGCLIKREVFENIGLPWFRTNWNYIIPETNELRVVGGTGMGADFFFSLRCQKENIPIYLDCGQILHHMELNHTTHFYKKIYPDEVKMNEMKKLKGVA